MKRKDILCKHGERGAALVEALVAIAILGGGVLTLVIAMSGGAMAVLENDEQATAQGLARAQLEYTKSYAYDPGAATYPVVTAPDGFAVSVGVTSVPGADADIQKITANITREGAVIMAVEDYKVNR